MENEQKDQTSDLLPEQIYQNKIEDLVKTVSNLQKEKAILQVELTNKKIELDTANHLIDARTASAKNEDSVSDLIDENDLSSALMKGDY